MGEPEGLWALNFKLLGLLEDFPALLQLTLMV
jgi:hypothetical protein